MSIILEKDAPSTERPVTKWDLRGLPDPVKWGFLGVLLFMSGVGVESNFLTPHLVERLGEPEASISVIITWYSLAVFVGSYMAGVLSDLWGPKRVMAFGAAIWVVFQVGFLLAVSMGDITLVGWMYFFRGFGMPLFSFAFLVWINLLALPSKTGTAIGWFYVMYTGGLPTIGTLIAAGSIPALGGGWIGERNSMILSTGLVILGVLVVMFGCRHESGTRRLAPKTLSTSNILMSGLRLTFSNRKILQGFLVRLINTAPQFGMFIIMPAVITSVLGWGQTRWLLMTVFVYAGNILFNAFFGSVGDRYGWVRTVRWCGIFGSAVGLLAWWYVPHIVPAGSTWGYVLAVVAGVLYGIMLAGFVPMGAIMPKHAEGLEPAAMAMYTTAAGGSTFLGTLTVAIVLNVTAALGWSDFASNSAVIWVFVLLYVAAFIMVGNLRSAQDDPEVRERMRREDAAKVA